MYVVLVSPAKGITFLLHCKVGVEPPLVMFAVNVTDIPGQIVAPGLVDRVTAGVKIGFTVFVIELLVALTGDGQTSLLVTVTEICSPLVNPVVV